MISVSYLQKTYWDRTEGLTKLHQSIVTDWADYADWSAFVEGFETAATYPGRPTSKMETYGWTPTLFEPQPVDLFDETQGFHVKRHGDFAAEHLTLFIADLDNHTDDQPRISIDDLAAFLSDQGLTHYLYTSFSHTDEKHKVRIIIPVDRPLTPDEAFECFIVMNAALNLQLDGSIYDPGDHLYGPHGGSETRRHDSSPMVVDDWIAVAADIPAEIRAHVKRGAPKVRVTREPTAEELEAMKRARSARHQTGGVSIHNPAFFNPAWFDDLRALYVGGSRHQTVQGLLTRAWIKSQMTLTRMDLETLQSELDLELNGYLSRAYGRAIMATDIDAVMRIIPTEAFTPNDQKTKQLEKEIARLNKRREK